MKTKEPVPIRRADYRAPDFRVSTIDLDIALDPQATRVKSRLSVEAAGDKTPARFHLDGEHLKLISIAVDGKALAPGDYKVSKTGLSVRAPGPRFTLETEVEIDPAANTALSGLYLSKGIFCTQCEAEGFRRITFFPDRPDIMAVYRTRIEADKRACPVLLSNGNPVGSGELPGGRHFAVWHDPFPKPSYLFAMVAGDLGHIRDGFRTRSGRNVDLRIYVDPGNESRATYAMESLKRAMKWDEDTFGLEYDLDIFMIVAVSAFNSGAMENKGLNIFNDKYVLADPETATDLDYHHIESIVAHEYFHNWTGNRITCRDWFQLCLKEGLTVFRDQEFSADMNSRAVQRISDVSRLRRAQFPEDQGPLAHPARPDAYLTIDNFYTATVYEKGAEICRMLSTVLGRDGFRKGMDLYFQRHDGEAQTVDAFVTCFEDANGADLTQFRLWWAQAGTPDVAVKERYDAASQSLTLTLTQMQKPTPGQKSKQPLHLPLRVAFLSPSGAEMPVAFFGETPWNAPRERVLHLTQKAQSFRFVGLAERPIVSINRGFTAPVVLKDQATPKTRAFQMGRDSDLFNRWEAAQASAGENILKMAAAAKAGRRAKPDPLFVGAAGGLIADAHRDRAFTALALTLPTTSEMITLTREADPDALHAARTELITAITRAHRHSLEDLYAALDTNEPYAPDAEQAGRRALRNTVLRYLCIEGGADAASRAYRHFARAQNMTDLAASLGVLVDVDAPEREAALAAFHDRFQDNPLVIDKWMTVQALSTRDDTLERIETLTQHRSFDWANPNRVRALVHAFALSNPVVFNRADGAGHIFAADAVLKLDGINPQVAARLVGAFEGWRRLDKRRQASMKRELTRIADTKGLSRNVYELATKSLGR